MVVLLTQLKYLELNYFMPHKFTYNEIEYIVTGPIEVISNTQLHVETDKGIILVDNTMDIYQELVSK